MKSIKSFVLFIVILLLCGGGVGLFYRSVKHVPAQSAAVSRETAPVESGPVEKTLKVKNAADYQIILERNLFGKESSTQEMEGKKRNPLDGLPPTTLDVMLLGTVYGDAEEKRAVIFDEEQKTQDMYHVGDSIKGALIKDILRGTVILNFKSKDEILEMSEAKDQAPSARTGSSPLQPRKIFSGPKGMEPSRHGNEKKTIVQPSVRRSVIRTNKKAINE